MEEESYGSRKREKYGSTCDSYLFILGRGLNNAFLSIVGKIKLLKTLKVKVTKICNYQHMPFTCV